MTSTSTLLTLVARLCYQAKDYDLLVAQLTTMSKKHGQLKEAVVRMVDESMTWLPELKEKKDKGEFKGGKDRWLELLNTLRDITEGKVGHQPQLEDPGQGRSRADMELDLLGARKGEVDRLAGQPSRAIGRERSCRSFR